MPWGGTYTVELRRRFGPQVALHIGELSRHHYTFIAERMRQEGLSDANLHDDLIKGGRFPHPDNSIDAVFAAQALEHTPEPERVLDEIVRVLKPGGHAVITVRNRWSRYGWYYHRHLSREQVPNQGPFVPLSSFAVRRGLLARFVIEHEKGISLQAEFDATQYSGAARFFCRLYAARVIKRG